jgi:hypothetical protein
MIESEPSYYIFVANDVITQDGRVASTEAIKQRLEKLYWAIPEGMARHKHFKQDDIVVFYASGSGKSNFIATATLASEAIPKVRELELEFDYIFAAPYGVKLTAPTLFSQVVPARELLSSLQLFKNLKQPNGWGAIFKRGAIRIVKEDYMLILEKANVA